MRGDDVVSALDFGAIDGALQSGEALILDLDGYEGPLHLLLALARSQTVDLTRLSIATLADQYLAYMNAAHRRRFTVAADYLVMAAWLTFLKSRLLLPRPEPNTHDEPAAEEVALALAFRLAKLDAMRAACERLKALPRTGRDVFTRADPDALAVSASVRPDGDLFQLMSAYVAQRQRQEASSYRAQARVEAYGLEEARTRLRELLPRLLAWTPLARVAPVAHAADGPARASYVASTFAAGLEMVKEGALDVHQLDAFSELYIRARSEGGGEKAPADLPGQAPA